MVELFLEVGVASLILIEKGGRRKVCLSLRLILRRLTDENEIEKSKRRALGEN